MKISPILPQKIDTYRLIRVDYIGYEDRPTNQVNVCIESISTGRLFCDVHYISKGDCYSKRAIRAMLLLFKPSLEKKRITFSRDGFEKINMMPSKEVKLTYSLKLQSTKRTNIKKSILKKSLDYHYAPFDNMTAYVSIAEQQEALQSKLPHDVEYRRFHEPRTDRENVKHMNKEIHRYECEPTDDTYYLCTLHFRGNDTLYFIAYNTYTQQYYYETDWTKIHKFALNSEHLIIIPMVDLTYLECIMNLISIQGRSVSDLFKQIISVPKDDKIYINAISVQELLTEYTKPNYIAETCYPYIRTGVYGSEAENCYQAMENLKYVFDTQMKLPLSLRRMLIDHLPYNNKKSSSIENYSFSKLIDTHFYKQHTTTYTYSLDKLVNLNAYDKTLYSFLANEANIQAYGDNLKGQKDLNKYVLDEITLKVGSTGFGGLRGSLYDYTSSKVNVIYYIDFSSMYPTILINNKGFDPPIDMDLYQRMYNKKFTSNNPIQKLFYKRLINTLVGILNTSKALNCKAPEIWKAIIKSAQITMLELLAVISQDGHLKILNVNTDGVYIEASRGYAFDTEALLDKFVKDGFKFSVKCYNRIHVKNASSLIIDVDGRNYIAKGDFKRCGCKYILDCIVAKQLRGKEYDTVPYTLSDLLLLDELSNERYLVYSKVSVDDKQYDFSKFKVDSYDEGYIQQFGYKNNVVVPLDLGYYWSKANMMI